MTKNIHEWNNKPKELNIRKQLLTQCLPWNHKLNCLFVTHTAIPLIKFLLWLGLHSNLNAFHVVIQHSSKVQYCNEMLINNLLTDYFVRLYTLFWAKILLFLSLLVINCSPCCVLEALKHKQCWWLCFSFHIFFCISYIQPSSSFPKFLSPATISPLPAPGTDREVCVNLVLFQRLCVDSREKQTPLLYIWLSASRKQCCKLPEESSKRREDASFIFTVFS